MGIAQPFSIDRPSGIIDPFKSYNVEIVYHPTTRPHDEQTVVMNVAGGAAQALKLIGDTGVPKCAIAKKTVNFGPIPIGIAKSQTVKMKNNGDDREAKSG
jgi:hypothetical protein